MRRETLTRRQMLTLMSSSLVVVGSGAFTEAHAETYWTGFGDFRIGDVHFSVGVHSAHTGRSGRHPGYYYRTTHRLNYKKHQCGAYCYRRSNYDYHHESCPLLGVHFERYGASPAYYAPRSREPTLGGWVEDLGPDGLQARCITGFNAGPPMTPGSYNNNMQLFQTPDTVVIFNEMVHTARIIPLDGRPHGTLRQYVGDSRAHWEGDTLVVTTTNFLRETSFLDGGSSADLQLTERFTRAAPDMLVYRVRVDDSTTFTRPWTYEVPMQLNPEPIYEYACHEGNYGLYNILAGAAVQDSDADEAGR